MSQTPITPAHEALDLERISQILGCIKLDLWEHYCFTGEQSTTIFMSIGLYRLLCAYNRAILFHYECPDRHHAQLMGRPVKVFHPENTEELSYHLALPVKKF